MMDLEYIQTTNQTELLLDKAKIFNHVDPSKRKTKIICTLGYVSLKLNKQYNNF